jgi:hypothetical protein
MAKCSLVGCTQKPTGGFLELIDASDFDHPDATLDGLKQVGVICIEICFDRVPMQKGAAR